MSDVPIPEDVRNAAVVLWNEIAWEDDPSIPLARALMAERERTAHVVMTMPSRYGEFVQREEAAAAIRRGTS